jgi:hypothetical protein
VVVVEVVVTVDVTVWVGVVVVSVLAASLVLRLTTNASITPATRASMIRIPDRRRDEATATSWPS